MNQPLIRRLFIGRSIIRGKAIKKLKELAIPTDIRRTQIRLVPKYVISLTENQYYSERCTRICVMVVESKYNQLHTRVGTLIVATLYLQLIQNRYTFRSFTVLQCSHQHCVQPVSSDVEVVGYL